EAAEALPTLAPLVFRHEVGRGEGGGAFEGSDVPQARGHAPGVARGEGEEQGPLGRFAGAEGGEIGARGEVAEAVGALLVRIEEGKFLRESGVVVAREPLPRPG